MSRAARFALTFVVAASLAASVITASMARAAEERVAQLEAEIQAMRLSIEAWMERNR